MASNYIKYQTNTAGGQAVWNVVDGVLKQWYAVQRIKAEMDSLLGNPADYTALVTPFGLETGEGQTFYTAVANLKANLDAACAALKDMDKVA
jgi:hypothetical protein